MSKTFNETKQEVHQLRKYLIEYYNNHEKGQLKKYKPCHYKTNLYCNLNLNGIIIEADTKLACIIIFNDYLNENLKTVSGGDAFGDDAELFCDVFYEEYISDNEDADILDIDKIDIEIFFKHESVDKIIHDYIETKFENDTLWFEETIHDKFTILRGNLSTQAQLHLCPANDDYECFAQDIEPICCLCSTVIYSHIDGSNNSDNCHCRHCVNAFPDNPRRRCAYPGIKNLVHA